MGQRGPAPKRSDQRLGHRSKADREASEKVTGAVKVRRPPASRTWHKAARQWYDALSRSAQHKFYEDSDWALAWAAAEALSRELSPKPLVVGRGESSYVEMVEQPLTGTVLQAFLKANTALLATEGDRRRAALELQRPKPAGGGEEAANVSSLDAWRARTDGTG